MTLLRPERRAGTNVASTYTGTYNPFDNPAIPLQSVGFDNVFGFTGNDAGEAVTPDTAAAVATFYRCLFLLSSVVASCPLEVYRLRDHAKIQNPLLDPSNDEMTYTPFELMQLIMIYRLVWGNSYVYKKRDNGGQIIDLKPLYPDAVGVTPDMETGRKIFLVRKVNSKGFIDQSGKPDMYTDWDIMHIPGMGYNGLTGAPMISLMQQTIGTAIAADKLAARFYSQGSQLGGIIKVKAPLSSQAQAEGIKARWMQRNAGVAHAGNVAVLDAETDFQSITIPPDQLQFLESRKWQTTEIARWFGIPPHLVGDVEKSTSWGTGIEQQNLGLHAYTLAGHTTPIEQRYTREVIQTRGHYTCFNLDSLMRGSTVERYQALQIATGGPWISVNEARVSENKAPLPDAKYDEILPPQGIGPAGPEANEGPDESGGSGNPG